MITTDAMSIRISSGRVILINDDDDFEVDDETNIQLFVYKYQNA